MSAARDVNRRSAALADAGNHTQYVGLGELRGGATNFIPAAGVQDDQAAVRIFKDVCRMEIGVVTGDKIGVHGFKRGSHCHQHLAHDFVQS